jgi:PST family polysaccharide transporter
MLNVDYIVVGRTLGAESLGIYLVAFNLSSWPVNAFSSPVRRVALPGFAKIIEDPEQAAASVTRAWTLLLAATLPAALLLAAFAQPLIGFLYGDKWLPSAPALRFLAILAVVRVVGELGYDFLVAQGRSRTAFWVQGVWLVALAPTLVVAARLGGVTGVAVGHAAVAVLVVVPVLVFAIHAGHVPLRGLIAGTLRPLAACCLAAIPAIAVLELVEGQFAQLLIGGCLVLAVYAAAIYVMRQHFASVFPARTPTRTTTALEPGANGASA